MEYKVRYWNIGRFQIRLCGPCRWKRWIPFIQTTPYAPGAIDFVFHRWLLNLHLFKK